MRFSRLRKLLWYYDIEFLVGVYQLFGQPTALTFRAEENICAVNKYLI
jgi:hypothetical protein